MIIYVRKLSIYYRRCDMNINIYFRERARVLHGRLVTIENCQHMQRVIDVSNELNDIKSHVISLLGINHFTHMLFLRGCDHVLFRTAWPSYIHYSS
jgi:hypothetical protein